MSKFRCVPVLSTNERVEGQKAARSEIVDWHLTQYHQYSARPRPLQLCSRTQQSLQVAYVWKRYDEVQLRRIYNASEVGLESRTLAVYNVTRRESEALTKVESVRGQNMAHANANAGALRRGGLPVSARRRSFRSKSSKSAVRALGTHVPDTTRRRDQARWKSA